VSEHMTVQQVAHQARVLEEAIDSIDPGVFAHRRAEGGEPAPSRVTVEAVAADLRQKRIELAMWALHGRCSLRFWRSHTVEAHRALAEDVVRLLFPEGVI